MIQVGDRFGRLVVMERVGSKEYWSKSERRNKKLALWRCRCDCGNEVNKTTGELRSVRSCGCLLDEARRMANRTHGKTQTRLYKIYHKMKERCYNENSISYPLYGERGITICDEWLNDFQSFYDWAMENGYSEELSIDRIDVNGSYSPDNCRWATLLEQNNNKRNTVFITVNDVKHSLKEWSRITGINYHRLFHWYQEVGEGLVAERLSESLNGKSFEHPINSCIVMFQGKEYPLKEICKKYGVDYKKAHVRYHQLGWSIEETLELKKRVRESRGLIGIDKNGKVVEFSSIQEAAEILGVDKSSISHALNKDVKRTKGYSLFWKEGDYHSR